MKIIVFHEPEAQMQSRCGADPFVPPSHRVGGVLWTVTPIPAARAKAAREDGVYDTDNKGGPAHLVWPGRTTPETEDEFLKRILRGGPAVGALVPHAPVVPSWAVNPRIIDHAELPGEEDYLRPAWRDTGTAIEVDMTGKAQAVHRDHLRLLRKPALAALDMEYMRALEMGDALKCAEISAEKQALRDWPADPRIEACTSPDDLKALLQTMTSEAA